MKIRYHSVFKKNYKKRIAKKPNLVKKFKERILLFLENRENKTLRDHSLIGKMISHRAFSISGDIRVVYKFDNPSQVVFLDIGSHNQVY